MANGPRSGCDMLSIGALSSAAQGASYYERDGYYAKDDPEHREASGWAGKGAEELGLTGPVDPDTFRAVLEGKVPDGSGTELGRRGKNGEILHRPGRDLTFSAPKSVSLAALVGGDRRIVEVHDRAVAAALAWIEKNAAETRMKDPGSGPGQVPETGRMIRAGNQKIVAATFRHDTSRNLDPQLHTHAVLANMVQGEEGKWRSMANEGLYARQKLIGMLYRNELAAGLGKLGYGIEKTHADGRFEIAGVSREVDRGLLEPARRDRGGDGSARSGAARRTIQRLAERAALMTRAKKREVDRGELRSVWQRQASDLGFDAPVPDPDPGRALVAEADGKSAVPIRDAAAPVSRDIGGAAPADAPAGMAVGPESPPGRDRDRSNRARVLPGYGPAVARGGGGRLGDGAPLRARGGVLPHRSLRRRARPRAGGRRHRGRRARGGGAGEGRIAACRRPAGRRGFARHRPHGRRGARDDGADALGPGPRPGADARAGRSRGTSTRGRSRPGRRTR